MKPIFCSPLRWPQSATTLVTVRSETFAAAVDLFGRRGTIEIAALIGNYLLITTVYNALGMRLRADQEAELPHRAGAPVGAEWR